MGWSTKNAAVLMPSAKPELLSAEIHPTAVLGRNVQIGVGTSIMAHVVIGDDVCIGAHVTVFPGCYIGEGTVIGERTVLKPCVVVRERTQIGHDVMVDSGAVIGSDGFGFAPNKETGKIEKIPQVGFVVVKDGAHIGANATLDRATLGKTIVGENTIVGDLAQIAHNAVLGDETLVEPQVGICGSTCIGSRVEIGRRAGIVGHLKVEDGAKIQAGSGITKDVSSGSVIGGWPSVPLKELEERETLQNQLPELFKRVQSLEKRLS